MTMLEKDPRMPWISPMLVVKDVDASLKKYADAFGFEIGTAMQEEGKTTYGDMMHKGQMVLMFMLEKSWGNPALTPANSKTDSPVSLYVYVDNVDEQFVIAKQAGITVMAEPEDMPWGDRMARLQDSDGHIWALATRVAEYQVNEPATA